MMRIVGIYQEWGLEGDVLAVVSALTVGDRTRLTSDLEDVYSATGASHVLSLSGLHIAILTGILFFLFRPLKRFKGGRSVSSVLIVLFLWVFAFVSGLSSPVIRSVIMFSLYILSSLLSKDAYSGVFAVSLTAFVMLVFNPFYLFDISFQLSFVAVYSILLFYPLFSGLLKAGNSFCKYVWDVLALSMAAQLGTFPLILLYFGAFPSYYLHPSRLNRRIKTFSYGSFIRLNRPASNEGVHRSYCRKGISHLMVSRHSDSVALAAGNGKFGSC